MRHILLATTALSAALGLAQPAAAAPAYIALGDSITFGETDLSYIQSFGDRGYVGRFADTLASRNGGVRPVVTNLAIDGETTASFTSAAGRTTPVVGRTDAILAAQNLNYASNPAVSQRALFGQTVASQQALGNTINTVSVTLGFNDVAALASSRAAALSLLPSTLATYQANYAAILAEVRALAPSADLYLLGYFNPFPGDPANPANPLFAAGGPQLNGIIQALAAQFGGRYVDTVTPFLGNEAAYTFIDEQRAGSVSPGPISGVEPVGNVHPNGIGYDVIAARVAAAGVTTVPEPSALALLSTGMVLALGSRRRRGRMAA